MMSGFLFGTAFAEDMAETWRNQLPAFLQLAFLEVCSIWKVVVARQQMELFSQSVCC